MAQIERSEDNEDLLQAMHWVNILNSLAVIVSAVLIFLTIFTANLAQAFIAGYLLVFGLMLLIFEMRLTQYEDILRNDYGFMFTLIGRGLFLVFVGLLNLGVRHFAVGQYVGIFTVANALFNMYVLAKNPSWRTELALAEDAFGADNAAAAPGTASVEGAEEGGADGGQGASLTLMHWLNIINAVLIGAAASLGMPAILRHGGGMSEGVVAAYLVFFGCMLLAFELRTTQYEAALRLHYGFLFTYAGRGAFLAFVAALNFGIRSFPFGHNVGFFTLANLVVNIVVLHANPTYRTPTRDDGYAKVSVSGGSGSGGGGGGSGYQGGDNDADPTHIEGV